MPPRGVLWVMLNGSQKYYKKIIQMYIFILAEFTPKLFLLEKNMGRVYNRPFENFFLGPSLQSSDVIAYAFLLIIYYKFKYNYYNKLT
jgi:hypothetical protein